MGNKTIKPIAMTLSFAAIGIAAAWYGVWFVSHICFLMMGIIIGAKIHKNMKYLEKWARSKMENPFMGVDH